MSEDNQNLADVDLTQTPQESEEPKKEEAKEEEVKTVDQALFAFPGAPNSEAVEEWKKEFGEVLCSGFSNTELFVFRPLQRAEFINLQTVISQSDKPVSQYDVEDKIVATCVLWASAPAQESLQNKAGSLSTLHEQIMQASNFMNPAVAASYVARL